MTPTSPALRLWPTVAGFLLVGVPSLTGCSQKNAEKCADGQKVARQAIEGRDFALAKQWREYAYKHCDDATALSALDQEIVNREAAATAEAERAAKAKADTAALVKLYLEFVAANRAAPERASATPACDTPPEGAPAPKPGTEKDRFCTATRNAGAYALTARYWEATPAAAVRFTTTPDEPVDCAALGGTPEKTWAVPAVGGKTAQRSRCTLGGALAGLTAVVSGAAKADVHIFAPGYLEKDPASRPLLEGP
jgi:hypothetical protein